MPDLKLLVFSPEGVYIPDIAETFTLREDHPEFRYYANSRWRVDGYMKPWTPPARPALDDPNATFQDMLARILDESNREFDFGGGKTRLQWCSREEAVYVTGCGVSGTCRLLSDIVPGPYVNCTPEHIAEAREHSKLLIGEVLF